MTRISKLLGVTSLVAAGLVGSANATPINFTITTYMIGAVSTNGSGGNIVTGASSVTLPAASTPFGVFVSAVSGPRASVATTAGATVTAPVVFSNYTLPIGPSTGQSITPFTVTIGTMVFSFSQQVSNNYQFISYNPLTSTSGVLKEDFTGTVQSGAGIVGSTDSLSLQCQDPSGSSTCTVQIFVPSADPVPEPITMSVLGAGIAGLVVARRRRRAA